MLVFQHKRDLSQTMTKWFFCTKSKHRPYQSISSVLSQAATRKNKGSTYPWFVYCQHLFCWFGRFFSIVKWGFCSQPETQTPTERNWKFRWSTSSQSNSWNAAKNRNNKVKPEVRTVSSMCHSNAAQCESGGPSWAVHVMLSLRTRTRYCQASLAVGHSWEKFRGSKTSTADPPLPKTHTHTHIHTQHCLVKGPFVRCCFFRENTLFISLWGIYSSDHLIIHTDKPSQPPTLTHTHTHTHTNTHIMFKHIRCTHTHTFVLTHVNEYTFAHTFRDTGEGKTHTHTLTHSQWVIYVPLCTPHSCLAGGWLLCCFSDLEEKLCALNLYIRKHTPPPHTHTQRFSK